MSQDHPEIFDRALVRQRRQRATRGFSGFDFLAQHVSDDFAERLSAINRSFVDTASLGGLPQTADLRTDLLKGEAASFTETDAVPARLRATSTNHFVTQADEEYLPFTPQSLDLIVAPLTLHWVNDLPGSFIQIRRSLKPDGLFLGAMFGGDTLTELRQCLSQAEIELSGGLSPRVSPQIDIRDLGHLLQRAEFTLPVTDTEILTVRYDTMFDLMRDLRGMGETNCLVERLKSFSRRDVFLRAAEIYASDFADPDGRLRATFQIHTATGWAEHASQQKPLKPGSAEASLAEVLGRKERPLR